MDKKYRCPFCGSKTPTIETPFLELNKQGEHVKKTQPCCRWQASNIKWKDRHTDPITNKSEDLKDIAKWRK
jgi:hypothetical protein